MTHKNRIKLTYVNTKDDFIQLFNCQVIFSLCFHIRYECKLLYINQGLLF